VKKKLIGFAIMPDDEIHHWVKEVQWVLNHRFGLRISRQPPHITIKSPFESPHIDDHIALLESICMQMQPFNIEINGVSNFENGVIYFQVGKNEILHNFHMNVLNALHKNHGILPQDYEADNIIFHMSIAGEPDKHKLVQATTFLKENTSAFTWTVNKCGVLINEQDKGWKVKKFIDF
jgi:2'-5' RNA ligase